jgi:hypothetical protein
MRVYYINHVWKKILIGIKEDRNRNSSKSVEKGLKNFRSKKSLLYYFYHEIKKED